MTITRAQLVDTSLTRWYHYVMRCVRRAFLLEKETATAGSGSKTGSRNLRISLRLVDFTGRLFRQGKASISAELAEVFERLNVSAHSWQERIELLRGDRLLGRFFASSRAKLREIGERLGVRHLVNLTGCPIR